MRALTVVVALFGTAPFSASAQTLTGRVLEEGTRFPVAGALVSLVDREGEQHASFMADSVGRFLVTPPSAGEYLIRVVRIGYQSTESPLLALDTAGTLELELMMTAEPIGLEGFEVSVEREAEEMLGTLGVTPAQLGTRWIDRSAIEKLPNPGLPKDVIRWQNIGGVTIDEYDSAARDPELCVRFSRRNLQCAITVLDGAVIPPERAFLIDGSDIEAIAILDPVEATTFYGTQGGGGAVLIWTRRGGGR